MGYDLRTKMMRLCLDLWTSGTALIIITITHQLESILSYSYHISILNSFSLLR